MKILMLAMAEKELEELVGYLSQNAGSNYDDWLVVKFIYDSLMEDQDSKKYYQKAIRCLSSKFDVLQAEDYVRTEFERTLQIQISARNGDVKVVQELVLKCDKPNSPDHIGMTPLQVAARQGHADIVKLLAPFEKNPNAPDINGYTPIQQATRNGHAEVVKVLAPLSENPNSVDPQGWTPIQFVSDNPKSSLEIIQVLAPISKYPNAPDKHGWTPIQRAAKNGQTEIVRILAPLTKKGNTKDPDGLTPIERAVRQWNGEMIKILDPSHPQPQMPELEELEKLLPDDHMYNDPEWKSLSVIERQNMLFEEVKHFRGLLGETNWSTKLKILGFPSKRPQLTLKKRSWGLSLKRSTKTSPPVQEKESEVKMDFENDLEFQELVEDIQSKLKKVQEEDSKVEDIKMNVENDLKFQELVVEDIQSKLINLLENEIQIPVIQEEERAEDIKMDVENDFDQDLVEHILMLEKNQKPE